MPSRLPSSLSNPFSEIPLSQCLRQKGQRPFSSTPKQSSRQRRVMFRWLNGPGAVFKSPLPGSTNYLNAYDKEGTLIRTKRSARPADDAAGHSEQKNLAGDQPIPMETSEDLMPFPLNRQFRSQPVLSEELKDEIYKRIATDGQSLQVVSAELEVEMRRVGAVVRLKSVEKQWVEQGKRLATPYAKAVMSMLPQTPFFGYLPVTPHEAINDLPVHRATIRQCFYPVSESRHFTRVDAGRVFQRDLLPAESRIPHPELVQLHQHQLQKERLLPHASAAKLREMVKAKEASAAKRLRDRLAREEQSLRTVVPEGSAGRAEFRFRDVSVESVGKDGRAHGRVGAPYGFPHEDRKKGIIKIPRRVE